ncbi:hypothetical protein ['Catharanthus roseus' aster yellows phytoplasma]|nr:hypothetical protein ['Catharanthus roseus' aster yellows phytoplasma]
MPSTWETIYTNNIDCANLFHKEEQIKLINDLINLKHLELTIHHPKK